MTWYDIVARLITIRDSVADEQVYFELDQLIADIQRSH